MIILLIISWFFSNLLGCNFNSFDNILQASSRWFIQEIFFWAWITILIPLVICSLCYCNLTNNCINNNCYGVSNIITIIAQPWCLLISSALNYLWFSWNFLQISFFWFGQLYATIFFSGINDKSLLYNNSIY